MSRVRPLAATVAVLGLTGALLLTGCSSNSSSTSAAAASASASPAASAAASAAPSSSAASAVPSVSGASTDASGLPVDPSPIPSNLTKPAFCLLTAPLYDKSALPSMPPGSETGLVLAAKRLIKATQALGQAEQLKALTGKQVAEIQVTMAILLTLLQDPSLEKGTVEQMSKASGVDTNTLQIAQTQGFKDESAAAFVDLGTFCS